MRKLRTIALSVLLGLSLIAGAAFTLPVAAGEAAAQAQTLTGKDFVLRDAPDSKAACGAIVMKPLIGNVNGIMNADAAANDVVDGHSSLKFRASLYDVDGAYDYSEWAWCITLRDGDARGNAIHGTPNHGYIFMIDGNDVLVFKGQKDPSKQIASVSMRETLYAPFSFAWEGNENGKKMAWLAADHDWEFLTTDVSDGGVELRVRVDGKDILAYTDAADAYLSGGYNVRNNGTYQVTYTAFEVNGESLLKSDKIVVENPANVRDNEMVVLPAGQGYSQMASTQENFQDVSVSAELNLTDIYAKKGGWVMQTFLRHSAPGTNGGNAYKVVFEAGVTDKGEERVYAYVKRMIDGRDENLTGEFNLSLDAWIDFCYFPKFAISCTDNAETGAVDFKFMFANEELGTISDASDQKIAAAGGVTFWPNCEVHGEVTPVFYTRLSNITVSGQAGTVDLPDFSQAEEIDFTDMVKSTRDWQGQIRGADQTGMTRFTSNAMILTANSATKSAAFVREGFAKKDALYRFKLGLAFDPEVSAGGWNFLLNIRDSGPTRNTWDRGPKNSYCLAMESSADRRSTFVLKRVNNTTEATSEKALASSPATDVGFLLDGEETLHEIAFGAYDVEGGVRIAFWLDGKLIFDVVDTDEAAVREAGTLMLTMNGSVGENQLPMAYLKLEGMTEGEYREDIVIGVNESKPDDEANLYPEDVYTEPGLEKFARSKGCNSTVLGHSLIAGAAALIAAGVLLRFKRKEKKQ